MRVPSRAIAYGLLAAASLSWTAGFTIAAPLSATARSSNKDAALLKIGGRWYRDDDDDDDDLPEYDPPPRPAVRVYPYLPPPVTVYEPPVYGWIAPLRPSNCGQFRYWNGERCADARFDPPYIGPRW